MRILKILLILFSVVVFGLACYLFWFELSRRNDFQLQIYYEAFIYLGIGIVSSVCSVLYHIKSFRYYRGESRWNLDKKLPKFYFVGAYSFYAFLLFAAGSLLFTMIRLLELDYGFSFKDFVSILIFLVPGILGFIEVSVLIKRIRRLRKERELKNDISSIGNEELS